ncbi:MAG TPA: hypothetical protein VKY65_17380 [Alphaproteobacteria bacterium]|nr:hypothetical protein [Alphaproteobacteria bacterium]
MTTYRLYFRDSMGICGRQDFEASDDRTAAFVAETLSDACSDISGGCELWQGSRPIDLGVLRPAQSADEVRARAQEIVVECEEAIQRSQWAIARSQRLLERMNGLRVKR